MSDFQVRVDKIAEIRPHTNADRLELASLESSTYQFVVPKGAYQTGELCVYFPLDSLIPEPLLKHIGLDGKLSGKAKNRVKTIRLRGEISAGVVATVESISQYLGEDLKLDFDYKDKLGVTKFEPQESKARGSNNSPRIKVSPRPSFVSMYDIENVEKSGAELELLLEKEVFITEKLEGQHFSLSIAKQPKPGFFRKIINFLTFKKYKPYKFIGCSRNCTIDLSGGSTHASACINSELVSKLEVYYNNLDSPPDLITIRGEVVGPSVQSNIYRLDRLEFRLFDVEFNQKYLSCAEFIKFADTAKIPTVPVLYTGTIQAWLKLPNNVTLTRDIQKAIAEKSNFLTVFGNNPKQLAEGVVIKPMIETVDKRGNRLFIKQRSPEYLSKEK